MLEKSTRRKFDAQFKHDVLRMMQESNRKISDTAKDLGVRPELLYRWKSEFATDPGMLLMQRANVICISAAADMFRYPATAFLLPVNSNMYTAAGNSRPKRRRLTTMSSLA